MFTQWKLFVKINYILLQLIHLYNINSKTIKVVLCFSLLSECLHAYIFNFIVMHESKVKFAKVSFNLKEFLIKDVRKGKYKPLQGLLLCLSDAWIVYSVLFTGRCSRYKVLLLLLQTLES